MGKRSQRYSMIVDDGVVKALNVEEPGAFDVSSAEHMLASSESRRPVTAILFCRRRNGGAGQQHPRAHFPHARNGRAPSAR